MDGNENGTTPELRLRQRTFLIRVRHETTVGTQESLQIHCQFGIKKSEGFTVLERIICQRIGLSNVLLGWCSDGDASNLCDLVFRSIPDGALPIPRQRGVLVMRTEMVTSSRPSWSTNSPFTRTPCNVRRLINSSSRGLKRF